MAASKYIQSDMSSSCLGNESIYQYSRLSHDHVFILQKSSSGLADLVPCAPWAMTTRKAAVTLLILAFPFIFTYGSTWLCFEIRHLSKKLTKIPPHIPYMIPFLGSALDFGLSPRKFVTDSA
jgi:hypothetical protein